MQCGVTAHTEPKMYTRLMDTLNRASTELSEVGKSGVDAKKLGCVLYIEILSDLSKNSGCVLYLEAY